MDKERLLQNTRLLARLLEMTPRELVERVIITREDYEDIASYDEKTIELLAMAISKSLAAELRPYRTTTARTARQAHKNQ